VYGESPCKPITFATSSSTCDISDCRDGHATMSYLLYPPRAVSSSQTININRLKAHSSATCPYRSPSRRIWTWESLAVKWICDICLVVLTLRRNVHTHTDFTLDESNGKCGAGTVPRRGCDRRSVYVVECRLRRRICGKRRWIVVV